MALFLFYFKVKFYYLITPFNRTPGKLPKFVADLHSGKLHREFHHGPDPEEQTVRAVYFVSSQFSCTLWAVFVKSKICMAQNASVKCELWSYELHIVLVSLEVQALVILTFNCEKSFLKRFLTIGIKNLRL